MELEWRDFATALGLAIVLEGLLYAVLPGRMRGLMQQVLDESPQTLRKLGLSAACIGLFLVWVVRS